MQGGVSPECGLQFGSGFRMLSNSLVPQVSLHRRQAGRWMTGTLLGSVRFGPARRGCSSTRPAAPGWSRRVQGRGSAAGLGLRSDSSRSADIPLEVRFGSVSVLFGAAAAASHLPFSAEKGRGCRKEGEEEENALGIVGNVVMWLISADFVQFQESTFPSMPLSVERSWWHFKSLAEYFSESTNVEIILLGTSSDFIT